ncbi:MAG: type II toxin-antitoxin system VapC family toxin [Deltaproteobacteria bacterium]|nr:type II toxin-antitoxin system VapC family toxin [Deltaproteobacteria bacterium]
MSAMSIAELMIKESIGKINIEFNPVEMAHETGINILNFTGEDALALKDLPFYHKDPFDRMIIVQAINNGITIMTDDTKYLQYGCEVI